MEYHGRLFGRCGGTYFPLEFGTKQVEDLEAERDDLRAKLAAAREALESLAVGYRRVTGLDGAHDPELRGAETTLAAIEGEA